MKKRIEPFKDGWSYDVNQHGYSIWYDESVVYSAGNHKLDSQQYAQPGSVNAVSLKQLEKYAKLTLIELRDEPEENHV